VGASSNLVGIICPPLDWVKFLGVISHSILQFSIYFGVEVFLSFIQESHFPTSKSGEHFNQLLLFLIYEMAIVSIDVENSKLY
jgi:hypothetical protein